MSKFIQKAYASPKTHTNARLLFPQVPRNNPDREEV
jgi:hypothetical protein